MVSLFSVEKQFLNCQKGNVIILIIVILIRSYSYGYGRDELEKTDSLILVVSITLFRKNLRKVSKQIAIPLEFVDVMR